MKSFLKKYWNWPSSKLWPPISIAWIIYLSVGILAWQNAGSLSQNQKIGIILVVVMAIWITAVVASCTSRSFFPIHVVAITKPRVHVWTLNGFTRLCAHAEYEHAIWDRERIMTADPEIEDGLMLDPVRSIVFAKVVPDKHADIMYPTEIYEELVKGCIIEKCEMYVPESFARKIVFGHFFPPDQMYRLIWGADAEVPEKLKA